MLHETVSVWFSEDRTLTPEAGAVTSVDEAPRSKLRGIKAKFAEANPPLKIEPEWRTNPPSL